MYLMVYLIYDIHTVQSLSRLVHLLRGLPRHISVPSPTSGANQNTESDLITVCRDFLILFCGDTDPCIVLLGSDKNYLPPLLVKVWDTFLKGDHQPPTPMSLMCHNIIGSSKYHRNYFSSYSLEKVRRSFCHFTETRSIPFVKICLNSTSTYEVPQRCIQHHDYRVMFTKSPFRSTMHNS